MVNKLNNQKVLVFSDTHLTRRFDKRKCDFLIRIVKSVDKVIIVGDFWDSWFLSLEEFIKSDWNKLFPYLLDKNTVYIYGNHDPKQKNNSKTELFSILATDSYDLKINRKTYRFEHGRRILDINSSYYSRKYEELLKFADKKNIKFIFYFLNSLKVIGFLIFGAKLMCNSNFAKKRNGRLKKYPKDDWLICGDTHYPEVDAKMKFANSGCIMHRFGSYLVINDGNVKLHIKEY